MHRLRRRPSGPETVGRQRAAATSRESRAEREREAETKRRAIEACGLCDGTATGTGGPATTTPTRTRPTPAAARKPGRRSECDREAVQGLRAPVPPSDTASGAPLRDSSPNRRQSPQECRHARRVTTTYGSAPTPTRRSWTPKTAAATSVQRAHRAARRLAVDHDHTCCPAADPAANASEHSSAAPATGSSATSATTPTHSTAPSPSSATGPPKPSSTHSTPRTTNEPEPEPHRRSHPTCRRREARGNDAATAASGRCALTSPDEPRNGRQQKRRTSASTISNSSRRRSATPKAPRSGSTRSTTPHPHSSPSCGRREQPSTASGTLASGHASTRWRATPSLSTEYAEGMTQAGDEIIALLDGRP